MTVNQTLKSCLLQTLCTSETRPILVLDAVVVSSVELVVSGSGVVMFRLVEGSVLVEGLVEGSLPVEGLVEASLPVVAEGSLPVDVEIVDHGEVNDKVVGGGDVTVWFSPEKKGCVLRNLLFADAKDKGTDKLINAFKFVNHCLDSIMTLAS